jgi:hypothetical protein
MSTQICEKKILDFVKMFDNSNSILIFSSCLPKQAKENNETRMFLKATIVAIRWLPHFPLTLMPSWFNSQKVT